ncbi:MAG: dihydrofolate reductase family protein [Lentimicrobiaceae bacterium]|jgi:dihydrofolate reductase|nr:dihydrofolate reductase family protein [Lentimicrobiaceae bacterium]MDD4597704.1 dihydrofolate reductase family protein [Lentimicrobiaceae bacterium]MDY0026921.1 dihydrofolate reductase family protein [Lentimicrobium sp.]HAH57757.1 dihydrofolate reductase [Bacteroidales bacterium]
MRKIISFTFVSLNGFFKGENEDTTWHRHGEEEVTFSEESLRADNILLFGRKTYDMMSGFWPTPLAKEMFPKVATGMNRAEKIVFSNSLSTAEWHNTSILSGNIVEQIKEIKATPGRDMAIMGSGSIVDQFTDAALIDVYQIMIDPVVITQGTSIFNGLKHSLDLKLTDSRVFRSGVVLLTYERIRKNSKTYEL